MSEQEQFIIDEKSIFLNRRNWPIGRSRDSSDLYAFHGFARELVNTYRKSKGVPEDLQIPDFSFKEEAELVLSIFQRKVYEPKGQLIVLGPAVVVVQRRINFNHGEIGVWKKIIPLNEPPQIEIPKSRNFPLVERLGIWDELSASVEKRFE